MRVSVNPINTINVKVNQGGPGKVVGTSTFVGAATANTGSVAQSAYDTANAAFAAANSAIIIASSAYDTANGAYGEANTLAAQIDGGTY